jgi:hypothetical protein
MSKFLVVLSPPPQNTLGGTMLKPILASHILLPIRGKSKSTSQTATISQQFTNYNNRRYLQHQQNSDVNIDCAITISTDDDRSNSINRSSSITPIAGWNNYHGIAIATEPQSRHSNSTSEEGKNPIF